MAIRILQIVGGLNHGGTENWLVHVLRHIDRRRFEMDFLVPSLKQYEFTTEVESMGSRILPCLHTKHPWRFIPSFKRLLGSLGPYDVIHSHVHHFNGVILRTGHQAGVPMRIAHSHSDTSLEDLRAGPLRRSYLAMAKGWIARHATAGLAASGQAARCLFGKGWQSDRRWAVCPCCVDLEPFRPDLDRTAIRRELGLPLDALVIGHVGRFVKAKNHAFLLEILAQAIQQHSNTRLLLVGDGPLKPQIEQEAARLGMANKVIFTGARSDVPRLMKGAMDVFVFPSLHEGLGLALVEAQAAGLPCVISDVVPPEADVVPGLVQRHSLSGAAADWARSTTRACARQKSVSHAEALAHVERSDFHMQSGVERLAAVYSGN